MSSASFLASHHNRAGSLDSRVRDLASNWRRTVPSVLSVGLGGTNSKPVIFVYTSRPLSKRQRAEIPNQIDGVDVVIKGMGRVVPATR